MWINKLIVLLAVTIFLMVTVYNPVSAREIFVDNNDSGADFKLIQEAVNNSYSGDIILVYPGFYNESVDIEIQNVSILSESGNPEDTIVRDFNLSANNTTVSGFRIKEYLTLKGRHTSEFLYPKIENCTIRNNILESGIGTDDCYNSTIEKNIILKSGIDVYGPFDDSNFIISDNLLVDGDIGVSHGPYNCILLNNTLLKGSIGISEGGSHKILGNYISNSTESGITIFESSSKIENNTIVNCTDGIFLIRLTGHNTVYNNTLKSNDRGIYVGDSGGNLFLNNTISENNIGVLLSGSTMDQAGANSVLNNTISDNNIGILLEGDSSENLVANNRIELNKQCGVYVNQVSYEVINQVNYEVPCDGTNWFYNNIFNNKVNFFNDTGNYTYYIAKATNVSVGINSVALNITRNSGTNIVGGPFLGGNYWAKPDGTGFSQNCVDSDGDGICNQPYSITGNDTDYLPLASPPIRCVDWKFNLTEDQITKNESYQVNPAICNNWIVWQDGRNGNNDIYMYNLSTHEETQITTNRSDQYIPNIYGDNVVWNDLSNGNKRTIYMYNISTSTKTQIVTSMSDQWLPAIYKDKIVWVDYRDGKSDIYMYNLSTSKETRITTIESDKFDPDIYGDRIVWKDYRNGSDIYMYDLSTSRETQITPTESAHLEPAIYGDRIVWEDDRNGNLDIYMYNTSTCVETQVTTNESNQADPDLYEDKIVWADYRNGNVDIYMYDLSTKKEIQITTNESNQERPAIYGNRIVWTDNRNGFENPDIYMCTISEKK